MIDKTIYMLDSNVLIHDPEALFSFEDGIVGVPILVLEELDRFKGETTLRGKSTRQVIRYLDLFRERGSLTQGVTLDNGGVIQVFFLPQNKQASIPFALSAKDADNGILLTALCLKESGAAIVFVSKDLNARIKADTLGIKAVDYIKDTVFKEELYKGVITLAVPAIQLKKDNPEELIKLLDSHELVPNEFVLLESQHNSFNNVLYRFLGNKQFKKVIDPVFPWPFAAKNAEQRMALDLLLDPTVQIVTLLGPAGTGKTFLALLAGLMGTLIQKNYKKMLVARPIIPLGQDIGYLPGDVHEKLHSWMQPIYDNMELITHTMQSSQKNIRAEPHYKKGEKHKAHISESKKSFVLDELIKEQKISLEAITYMRGRSIPYQYIFIDEVQNLTPHEVKTIVSRVGEGSKIVLAGDPYQIDSPHLHLTNNGLVVTADKFKGQSLAGSVFLQTSERSELSKLAAELL